MMIIEFFSGKSSVIYLISSNYLERVELVTLPVPFYKYDGSNTQASSQIKYVEITFILVLLEKSCNNSWIKQNIKSYKNIITTAPAQMSPVRQSNSTDCPPTPSTNKTIQIVCPKVNPSPK